MIKDTRFVPFEKRRPTEEEEMVDFEEIFLKKPRKPGIRLYMAS